MFYYICDMILFFLLFSISIHLYLQKNNDSNKSHNKILSYINDIFAINKSLYVPILQIALPFVKALLLKGDLSPTKFYLLQSTIYRNIFSILHKRLSSVILDNPYNIQIISLHDL